MSCTQGAVVNIFLFVALRFRVYFQIVACRKKGPDIEQYDFLLAFCAQSQVIYASLTTFQARTTNVVVCLFFFVIGVLRLGQ